MLKLFDKRRWLSDAAVVKEAARSGIGKTEASLRLADRMMDALDALGDAFRKEGVGGSRLVVLYSDIKGGIELFGYYETDGMDEVLQALSSASCASAVLYTDYNCLCYSCITEDGSSRYAEIRQWKEGATPALERRLLDRWRHGCANRKQIAVLSLSLGVQARKAVLKEGKKEEG